LRKFSGKSPAGTAELYHHRGEPARAWSRLWAALPVLLALILLALWLLFAPR
jgi:hypothetical protein